MNNEKPIAEKMTRELKAIGVNVVGDSEIYDATLTINLIGKAAKDKYMFPGENKTCYSGSSYQGEMILSAEQKPDVIAEIRGKYTPISVSTCKEEPNKNVKWPTSWNKVLVDGIRQIWGKHGLLLIMDQFALQVTCNAAQQLYKNREELVAEDLPVLISSLPTCTEEITTLLQAMEAQAWEAIPALLDAWEKKGPDGVTYGTMMGYGTNIFQGALRKITETFDPRPDCKTLSCWRSWWGEGQPAP